MRIFPARDLAKTGSRARSFTHETLELAERESSFDWALHPTALAATVSVVVARIVQMPEAYWAAIATLVVMQSSLGATLTLSIERVVATALGASVGAVEANYSSKSCRLHARDLFHRRTFVWLSAGEDAYRYASVTLTIIVLIPRVNPAWIVALHRFIEVSVGIIVALLVVAIWPERSPIAAKNADQ